MLPSLRALRPRQNHSNSMPTGYYLCSDGDDAGIACIDLPADESYGRTRLDGVEMSAHQRGGAVAGEPFADERKDFCVKDGLRREKSPKRQQGAPAFRSIRRATISSHALPCRFPGIRALSTARIFGPHPDSAQSDPFDMVSNF